MTSMAFILVSFPWWLPPVPELPVETQLGRGSRRGMLAATFLAIFFVPLFLF